MDPLLEGIRVGMSARFLHGLVGRAASADEDEPVGSPLDAAIPEPAETEGWDTDGAGLLVAEVGVAPCAEASDTSRTGRTGKA